MRSAAAAPLLVYIAAPREEIERAIRVSAELAVLSGVRVVSTWPERLRAQRTDEATLSETELDAILDTNLGELRSSAIVVSFTCEGIGGETYAEIGRALERGIPVVWSKERFGLRLSHRDTNVSVVQTDAEAVDAVHWYAERQGRVARHA